MNIRYRITWPDAADDQAPHQFFQQLRAGVARSHNLPSGARFPFDCPYEVALVCSGQAGRAAWSIDVLAVRVTTPDIASSADTIPLIKNWIEQCAPGSLSPEAALSAMPATHLKLSSELGSGSEVVENFGTFVGEPEPESGASAPVVEAPAQLSPEAEALKALVGLSAAESTAVQVEKAKPVERPVTIPSPPASTLFTEKNCGSCGRLALIIPGVVLIPIGLALGGLMAIGQWSETGAAGSTTVDPAEFVFLLLCCPLPVLLLGIGLTLTGAFLPRLFKKLRSG